MMERPEVLGALALDYHDERVGRGLAIHADCLEWLGRIPKASLHGVVTDPPYGVKEFDADQIEKRRNGRGGIWRIPPSFDGSVRSPLPRFTALNARERKVLREFFVEWSRALVPALRPGAHVFVAGNPFLSQMVFRAVVEGGLEFGARSCGSCAPCAAATGRRMPSRSSRTSVRYPAATTSPGASSVSRFHRG